MKEEENFSIFYALVHIISHYKFHNDSISHEIVDVGAIHNVYKTSDLGTSYNASKLGS